MATEGYHIQRVAIFHGAQHSIRVSAWVSESTVKPGKKMKIWQKHTQHVYFAVLSVLLSR